MRDDARTLDQLRQHYAIERELARRLHDASRQDRRRLYADVYDELFRRVPLHPQLTRKASAVDRAQAIRPQLRYLAPFLTRDATFLEIGPGDCALSAEVAGQVKRVYAVDVSDEITKGLGRPPNLEVLLSDGSSVPVPPGSVDVAYSNQLMEHLHPDDAVDQLRNIFRALAPGGVYVCITPNRLNGPHDISRYFDEVATGFHLKEYITSELSRLFTEVGFSRVRVDVGAKGRFVRLPAPLVVAYEAFLAKLPRALRRALLRLPFRLLLGTRFVGTK